MRKMLRHRPAEIQRSPFNCITTSSEMHDSALPVDLRKQALLKLLRLPPEKRKRWSELERLRRGSVAAKEWLADRADKATDGTIKPP